MILEQAVLHIKENQSIAFERDFAKAEKYISSIEGYQGHRLLKCFEVENKYLLLVEWDSVDSHEIGFRQSEVYQEWKKLLHHYYEPFPNVEHYQLVEPKEL